MPPTRRVILVGSLSAAAVLAALAVSSVQRIPEGSVGLAGARIVQPGLRLHAPFAALPVVASPGKLAIDDLAIATPEGSKLVFRLDLEYEIGSRLGPQLAADAARSGFRGAVRVLADKVLHDAAGRSDTASLLSSPSLLEAPLKAALEGSGVSAARLSFRSPLGDEVLRRKATEAVRADLRPPLAHILVVGWDGADWHSILPLVRAGKMPNMARILRDGAHANLRSYDPMYSPLLWTTVATGKPPTEHGIADFLVRDITAGTRHPITSDFRKVKALWNIFTDFGRKSSWIAWWASYPAEKIDGVEVTDILASSVMSRGPEKAAHMPNVATPADFLPAHVSSLVPTTAITRSDVARFFSVSDAEWRNAQDIITFKKKEDMKADEGQRDPAAFMIKVLSATRTFQGIAIDLVRSKMPFVAVYFEGVDMMGHRFQHYLPPKMHMVSEADYERFQHAVTTWYEYQDELLGDLLRAAPKDTIVVILSDHGFRTGAERPEGLLPYTKGQPVEWHRDWGILALCGPGIRPGELPPQSIYDVAPTLLYLEGFPLASDMPGRLVTDAFEAGVLERRPPQTIRSYELAGPPLERQAAENVDATAMAEMMENLKALGYVGGAPARPVAPEKTDGARVTSPAEGVGDKIDTQYYYHRNLATSYIRQGRFKEAEAELEAANARYVSGKTYEMLSQVRATMGHLAEAARTLEEGWEKTPESMNPQSLAWIVDLHLMNGDRAGAEKAAERWSAKMDPGVKLAVDGRLAEADGDGERAASLYRQALEKDPLLVQVAQRLHGLDIAAGHPFAIEPFLLRTLHDHDQVDAYWDLAGQFSLARGDLAEAVARFKKASDLQPENGLYLGHLASAEAASGDTSSARRALAWANRFPPRDPDAWMALGGAWDRLGDADRAVAAFDAAKKAGLSGPGADIGSALALARAGRMNEARRVLEAAAARFPQSTAVRQLRARLGG